MCALACDTTTGLALVLGESGGILAVGSIVALVVMRYELGWLSRRASKRRAGRNPSGHEDPTSTGGHEQKRATLPTAEDVEREQAARMARRMRRDNESDGVAGVLWLLWAGIFGGAFLVWDPSETQGLGLRMGALMLGIASAIGIVLYAAQSRSGPATPTRTCRGDRSTRGPDGRQGDGTSGRFSGVLWPLSAGVLASAFLLRDPGTSRSPGVAIALALLALTVTIALVIHVVRGRSRVAVPHTTHHHAKEDVPPGHDAKKGGLQ